MFGPRLGQPTSARSKHVITLSRLSTPCAALLLALSARAHELPTGFILQPIDGGWNLPVAIEPIDATRMLVAEKGGRLWLVENDHKKNLVIDVSLETLTPIDRGLLAVALDPHFAQNGFVYLLLVVDPNADGVDSERESFARLVRVTTAFDPQGRLLSIAGSRVELIGRTWASGIPSCHFSHSVGSMRFLSDGSLVLSTGDGASYDGVDAGGVTPDCFGPGKFAADQDIGAFRSQYIASYSGKILRIDPATGLGLPDNPFFTGDPTAVASRVWARGLRNPFRFTKVDGSGPRETLIVGDVGWERWEEIDRVRGGENFGWPCFEGPNVQYYYGGLSSPTGCPPAASVTFPLIAIDHSDSTALGFTSNCIAGLAFYHGALYPPLWHDKLFFCDYALGWIRCAELDSHLDLVRIDDFARDLEGPIDLEVDPSNGDLLFIELHANTVERLRYVGSNLPPVIQATVEPHFGVLPLSVRMQASGSYSPSHDALDFSWSFDDGTSSRLPDVVKVYTDAIVRHVRLTVTDEHQRTATQGFLVTPGNRPPILMHVMPPAGTIYHDGDVVRLRAVARDLEDDPLGIPLSATWNVDLVHDHHEHPGFATIHALVGQFVFQSQGPGTNFRATLTVEDSSGLPTVVSFPLYDAATVSKVHLVSLSDTTLREGQTLHAVGHVHHPGDIGGLPRLIWNWGDGTSTEYPAVQHFEDTTPDHVYPTIGDFALTLTSDLAGATDSIVETVHVREARPAFAVFTPLVTSGWIDWQEQEDIAESIVQSLSAKGFEAVVFRFDQQDELRAWMEAYVTDRARDVLVILDAAPALVYAGQDDGSLAERWLDHGNAIVWSGARPFATFVDMNGTSSQAGAGVFGADDVLDAIRPRISGGSGLQILQRESIEVPDLVSYDAQCALRYDQLGAEWTVRSVYATDSDNDSDAILIENRVGGLYAQFFCTPELGLPRREVLVEFLHLLAH